MSHKFPQRWSVRPGASLVFGAVVLACNTVPDDVSSPQTLEPDEAHWIAFQSGRSGEGDLYATDPSSGAVIHVLNSPHPEGGVRYDAARRRLIHQRFPNEEGPVTLWSGDQSLFDDPNGLAGVCENL